MWLHEFKAAEGVLCALGAISDRGVAGGLDLKWIVLREGLGASPRPCLDENDA